MTNNRRNTPTSQRSSSGRNGARSSSGSARGTGREGGTSSARGTGRESGSSYSRGTGRENSTSSVRGVREGSSRTSSTRSATTNNNRDYVSSNGPRSYSGSKHSGGNGSGGIIIAVIVVVAIAAIGLFGWSSVNYLYDENIIIPGVEVGGVNLSGMTSDEAKAALNDKLNENIDALSITITHNGNTWSYDSSNLNASGDISSIVDNVLKYGHEGNLGDRMDQAEYVKNNAEPYYLNFEYDQNIIRQIVEALQDEIEIKAVEPALVFDETAGKITGIEDRTALFYNPLRYDTLVNINGAPAEVYIDGNGNYKINAEIFSTEPGSNGLLMDVDATYNAIMYDLQDDNIANVEVITNVDVPTLNEEDLFDYTSLVYHSKSSITSNSTFERDKNIDLALAAFDGMVIMPGEEVSFNNTTGERISENGYLLAPGISQDKSLQLVYGGGVCQAATIIFNAAIMAGCEIIDKDSHSWPLYWQEGNYGTEARDAMVNWGTSDLIFKNTTDYPIYFDTYVYWKYADNATHAYCNVYTKLLPDGQSIKYDPILVTTEETPEAKVTALSDTSEYADETWKLDEESGLMIYKRVLSRPYKYYEVDQIIVDSYGNEISRQQWYKSEYGQIIGEYYTKPNPNG